MTTPEPDLTTEITPSVIRATIEGFAEKHSPRPVALRCHPDTAPRWTGTTSDGTPITAIPCVSTLAAREALRQRVDGEWLVLLTNRSEDDLGVGICAHLLGMRVRTIDPWESLRQQFRASHIAASLYSIADARKIALSLISDAPERGWPAAPGGILTKEHALDSYLAEHLKLATDAHDMRGIIAWSITPSTKTLLARLDDHTHDAIRQACLDRIAEAAGAASPAVRVLLDATRVNDLAAIGLVAHLLTDDSDHDAAERQQAQICLARAEQWWGGEPRSTHPALRAFGHSTTHALTTLLDTRHAVDGDLNRVLDRADTLLSEIEGLTLAQHSTLLPSGYRSRAERLGRALADHEPHRPDKLHAIEEAWTALEEHRLRSRVPRRREIFHAAVRLARWTITPDTAPHPDDSPATALVHVAQTHLDDGCWADAAINTAAVGVDDDHCARGIENVIDYAHAKRAREAQHFAGTLAEATALDTATLRSGLADHQHGVILIEDLLDRVVATVAGSEDSLLLIVLDGMSAGAATSITTDVVCNLGWEEICLPGTETTRRRMASIAALPTLTEVSRTSLFVGALAKGRSKDETEGFNHYLDHQLKRGGRIFHKGTVDSTRNGWAIAESVAHAIEDVRNRPVVAVILNTIDDALDRSDPGGTTWTADTVKHLKPLLEQARAAGRKVILTADHGHIVERRQGSIASHQEISSNRSRTAATPADPETEILVQGERVVTPDHRAVLAVSDRLRYGPLKAGYHGGAHPAEVVVPVIILRPTGAPLDELVLPPQDPRWWTGPLPASITSRPVAPPPTPKKRVTATPAPAPTQDQALFDVPAPTPPATPPAVHASAPPVSHDGQHSFGTRVTHTSTYQEQQRLAPRVRLTPEHIASLIDALDAAPGNRLPRVSVAQALGIPEARVQGAQEHVKQLLNVDGYAVLSVDADGTTLVLDRRTLEEQFGVTSG